MQAIFRRYFRGTQGLHMTMKNQFFRALLRPFKLLNNILIEFYCLLLSWSKAMHTGQLHFNLIVFNGAQNF